MAVVDEAQHLVGGTFTVFQRMNKAGDMLRIATNVIASNGKRATGTYIPAVNPNGQANAVIETILRGETFRGRAYVVNAWYVTVYEPLRNAEGEIIGILYAGIPFELIDTLRESILSQNVGETGYAFVLGGSGNQQGETIIHGPLGSGVNLWDATDSDDEPFIQTMVNAAIAAGPNETATTYYDWIDPGQTEAREKIGVTAYYEPWDWVIGAGTYSDEYEDALNKVSATLKSVLLVIILTIVVILATVLIISVLIGGAISRPITSLAQCLGDIADRGVLNRPLAIYLNRRNEIGTLAQATNNLVGFQKQDAEMLKTIAEGQWSIQVPIRSDHDQIRQSLSHMVAEVNDVLSHVKASVTHVDIGSNQIADASNALSQGATESAASLEEVAASVAEVASRARENAQQAKQAGESINDAQNAAQKGNQRMLELQEAMTEITAASHEIARINKVIDDIAFQTNLLALNAAVEAARAGRHGKGFAVVAAEVRALAGRSAKAANETSGLIEQAITRVQKGETSANETAAALGEISDKVTQSTTIMSAISSSSVEAAEAINQVNLGLGQIDQVTQANTASAEETAAAAKELASQAQQLASLVGRFSLQEEEQQLKLGRGLPPPQ